MLNVGVGKHITMKIVSKSLMFHFQQQMIFKFSNIKRHIEIVTCQRCINGVVKSASATANYDVADNTDEVIDPGYKT